MPTREEKIYGSTYEELRNTLQERLRAHRELNRRATDLAKIDLLSVSVLVSGLTFSGQLRDVFLYFTAGVLSLLYSLWHCVHVYRLRHFARGLAGEAADEVAAGVASGLSTAAHYENLAESYRRAIVSFRSAYYDEVSHFRSALWASITSIVFVAAAAVRLVLPRIHGRWTCRYWSPSRWSRSGEEISTEATNLTQMTERDHDEGGYSLEWEDEAAEAAERAGATADAGSGVE